MMTLSHISLLQSTVARRRGAMAIARLAASRFARLGGTAFCPLQKIARPALPALGHLRDRQQPIGFMAIMHIDAEDVANREIMIGSLDHPDLVAGPHIALDHEAQIRPGPQRVAEA